MHNVCKLFSQQALECCSLVENFANYIDPTKMVTKIFVCNLVVSNSKLNLRIQVLTLCHLTRIS